MLITKLRKRSAFTQTAGVGGENGVGSEGMEARDMLGSARICWMLLRWNAEAS